MKGRFDDVWEYVRNNIERETIGQSLYGEEIEAFGSSEPQTVIVAGVHAREFASLKLAFGILESIISSKVALPVAVIPVLNPDGLKIVEFGADAAPEKYRDLIASIGNFAKWKANGRGVDLNVNFDAEWGCGKQNVKVASFSDYIGEYPFSEPESRAVKDYLDATRPREVWAFHSRGEVVYHGFGNVLQEKEASRVASLFGYPFARSLGSAGGLKDWYVLSHGSDGYAVTVELGPDGKDYAAIADDEKYMQKLQNRVYGYLISDYL